MLTFLHQDRLNTFYRFGLMFMFICCSVGSLSAQLQADFSMDKPGGCSPVAISFTNKTTGASANAVYDWDFGNGNNSSLFDGGAIYTQEQIYTVTLTVKDGSNTSSKTAQITVYKNPTVDFSASVTKGCLPLPVTFTSNADPGSGTISGYTWDFGDGNTSQVSTYNQIHTYTVVQNPIISLTATNSYGCHSTLQKSGLINVIPGVTANITADKNFLCLITDPVQFTSTSTGPGTLSYLWDFGDGNGSTQQNPQYVFNKKGVYTVKLKVNSSEGCTATASLSDSLNVASFNTDFTIPPSICSGSSYVFTNTSSPGANSSTWFLDGNPVGANKDLKFTAGSAGNHTVSLTNLYGGCTQNTAKNIVVNDLPTPAGFTYTEQGKCGPPETVVFTDISNATKHEWSFAFNVYDTVVMATDKQPSYNYTNNDNYHLIWLRSTNEAGCSINTTQFIFLYPPVVTISSDGNESTCGIPNTQHFTSSRTDLASYLWHFGDGTTSTEVSPTHTYTAVGGYTVNLTFTTTDGCIDSSTNHLQFYVSPPLQIDFTAKNTSVCGNTGIELESQVNDPDILYWTWYYGDGQQSYPGGSNSIHTYDQPGTYDITLVVTSAGCTASLTKPGYITVAPMFFNYTGHNNTCDADRGGVFFIENSTQASRLLWDFGDGSTMTTDGDINGFTHDYLADGNYIVNVTAVSDQYQCSISHQDNIVVFHKQNPRLTADKMTICTNDVLTVKVDNYNLNPWVGYEYPNFTMKYEYGDGTPFTGNVNSLYYLYANEFDGELTPFEKGKKDLRVITTSAYFGCNDTSNYIPLQIRGANAGFEIVDDNRCLQSPVVLKDISTVDPGNSIASWLWEFGDGSTLNTGGTVTHQYVHPGNYQVKLTVTDASGCSATSSDNTVSMVSVNGPEAAFTTSGNNVIVNSTVVFNNTTNTYGSLNTVYSWKISDGTNSTANNISHTFPAAGDYTVTLTSSDPVTGCSSSTTQLIHVSEFNSSFSVSKSYVSGTCPPVLISFNNTSSNFIRVSWDFGDGSTAGDLNNPSHIYKDPGKYVVTLTVYGQNGLQEQYIDSVIVKVPSASLSANPFEACIGSIVTDTAKSVNTISYTWDFGDGSVINTSIPAASHKYLTSGIYNPKLLIQDSAGCAAGTVLSGDINIHPNPVATISPSKAILCQGSNILLQAGGGFTYQWTPATGLSNNAIADPLASPVITTTYHLDIADDLGCKNSANITVTVVNPVKMQISNDTSVCQGNPVQLNASGEMVYNWINNTEGLNKTNVNNPLANPQSTTLYTVTGTDANNCFSDTARVTVNILPLPTVNAGQDTTIQAGAGFVLQGSGSGDVVEWSWSPAKYLSCTDCSMPVCTTRENISYTLTGKTEQGCSASGHVTIKLECDQARIAIPNAFTPNRDGLNDLFVIKGISFVKHIVIYDRWGEKVFERSNFDPADPGSCWDGNLNGMEAATGTYVYFVEMQCPLGGSFSRKGTVVLIR